MINKIIEYFRKKKERKKLIDTGIRMGNSEVYSEHVINCYQENRNEEIEY